MSKSVIISLGALVFLVGGGALVLNSSKYADQTQNPPVNVNPNPDRVAAGYVAGHVTIGPNCPGPQREGQVCVTPPSAYSSREVFVYDADGKTVNEKGKIDSEGNYKIAVGPGNYFVQVVPAGIGPGEKKPVTIESFKTSTVDFDIDTGIR
jgi:hypothetical protein